MIQGKIGLNIMKLKQLGDMVKGGTTDIALLARQFGVKEPVMERLVRTKAWVRTKPEVVKRPVLQVKPKGDEGTEPDPK